MAGWETHRDRLANRPLEARRRYLAAQIGDDGLPADLRDYLDFLVRFRDTADLGRLCALIDHARTRPEQA